MKTITLDLTGLKCPLPALRTRKALARLRPGDHLDVRCTDPMAAIDIPHLVDQAGYVLVESRRNDADLQFIITLHSI